MWIRSLSELIRLDHVEKEVERVTKEVQDQKKELTEILKKQEYERGKGFWIAAGASALLSALVALLFWVIKGG